MLSILHTTTGLHVGGAEMMLLRLLAVIDRERFTSSVLSLLPPGPVTPRVEALRVEVHSLGLGPRLPRPAEVGRLWRLSGRLAPDVIQGWMYHGNLAGTLAWWRRRGRSRLVWGMHHSLTGLAREKPLTRKVIALSARLSRLPRAIVYCSRAIAREHEALGFAPERRVVIPNGIDTDAFRPDPAARARLDALLGGTEGRPLVGMVARLHPMKDHANLLRAAAEARSAGGSAPHVVLIGRDVGPDNTEMARLVADSGLGDRVSLLGERHDVADLVPGLDLFVLPSAWGEAFPLAVGEAMASGVPCLVTDVGDCAWLVGDAGEVVPPRDTAALAEALRRLLAMPADARRALGARARARVRDNFSLPTIVGRYEDLYADVAAR